MELMRTLQIVAGLLLASTAVAEVPRPAPPFSINLLDGTKLPVSKFRGKIVGLVFISTSCTHCQQFTQVLNVIQKDYGPRGVQVLMSAMDQPAREALPNFIRQFQPAYPMGWNEGSAVLTFLGVSVMTPGYVPKMVFIDRQGIIRQQVYGEDPFFKTQDQSVRTTLDALLKAPATATRAKTKK
jgi:peroxiredoxin